MAARAVKKVDALTISPKVINVPEKTKKQMVQEEEKMVQEDITEKRMYIKKNQHRSRKIASFVKLYIVVPSGDKVILNANINMSLEDCIIYLSQYEQFKLNGELYVYINELLCGNNKIYSLLNKMVFDNNTYIQIIKLASSFKPLSHGDRKMFFSKKIPTYTVYSVDIYTYPLFEIKTHKYTQKINQRSIKINLKSKSKI